MNLKNYLGATLVLLSLSAISQNLKIVDQHFFSDEYSIPNYVEFDKDQMPSAEDLDIYLSTHWKGKEDFDLRLKSTFKDQFEGEHLKYVQTFKGVDIEIAEWILHLKGGKIASMNGKLISEYPTSDVVSLSEKEALEAAIKWIGADVYKWELEEEEAFIKRHENDPKATYYPKAEMAYMSKEINLNVNELRLCYKFNVYAHEPMSRQEIYVDAQNGDIILSNSLINNSNVPSTAATGYSGSRPITTDSIAPNSFRLRQTAYGSGVNTFDLNNATTYGSAADFTSTSSNWNLANAQLDQYALDAHWATEQTYNYMLNKFGRNSINNAGLTLTSYVHYGTNYVNAFWNGQFMTYGDGNGSTITPLTPLDIVGHEIGHGLTAYTADLIYNRESGALNESFSDILGNSVEFYARPNRANWTMGEDIGITIRNMANPKQYGDPDTYGGTNWVSQVGCVPTQQNNLCGIHTNMGVQNYWYYLLSAGGSGTNDNQDSYSVTGISIDSAAAIAYRNLTVYLLRSSDFNEARFFSIRAAIDLFGECSAEVESVTNAWHAVGVGRRYVPNAESDFLAIDTSNCQAPFTVNFVDNSLNANTYFWDFGDGNTSTLRNPTHTYQNLGNYDVSLAIDGGTCGVDTLSKTSFVVVDTALFCEVLLNDGSNTTQTDCTGKIYDSGGSSGTYSTNENGTITISPNGAATVTLTFLSFDVEAGQGNSCNYDYLEIFDGSSTSANSIGVYCNNNVPTVITSTGSSITLQFVSDQAVEGTGFEIDWNCNVPTAPPVTAFGLDSTNSCLGEIAFQDLSSNAPNAWHWDFGDGNTSTQKDPIHLYNGSGNYTVKLVTTNQFGSDSLSVSNVVNIQRPSAPITKSDTFCAQQNAILYANGQAEIRWYDAIGGNLLGTADSLDLGPLTASKTVYAQDYYSAPTQSVGPATNTIGTGANFNNFQYLIFDVFEDMILERVTVYSGRSGNRAIQLRDGNGNPIETRYVFVGPGMQFINLDLFIPAGTDYQLGVEQGSTIEFYRNNSGTSYPYRIPGLVSIKRSSAQSNPVGFYYFFYDWKVKELDCSSPAVQVSAFLDTTCTAVGIEEINQASFSLYPNPAKDRITIEFDHSLDREEIIIRDVTGRLVPFSFSNVSAKRMELKFEGITSGLYYISIRNKQTVTTKPLVISRE